MSAHRHYRLDVTPNLARLRVHLRARFPEPPLDLLPQTGPGQSGSSTYSLTPNKDGEYIVELTNPGVGATRVRVAQETDAGFASRTALSEATVFDQMFPGPTTTVTLAGRTAYRIELTPEATFSVRAFNSTSPPPAVHRPLSEQSSAAGGVAWVLVPSTTDEYRVDVAEATSPVRVRIVRDPREQAILEGQAVSALGELTAGIRSVVLSGTVLLPATSSRGAAGWGTCLGVESGRIPFARRLGGCVMTYAHFSLPNGGSMTLYGIEPRYQLWSNGAFAFSVAAGVDITGKFYDASTPTVICHALHVGPHLDWLPVRQVPFLLEVEPAVSILEQEETSIGPGSIPARTQVLTRVVFGLHVHL